MKKKSIRCPYCGGTAVLRDASYVYGGESGHKHLNWYTKSAVAKDPKSMVK